MGLDALSVCQLRSTLVFSDQRSKIRPLKVFIYIH